MHNNKKPTLFENTMTTWTITFFLCTRDLFHDECRRVQRSHFRFVLQFLGGPVASSSIFFVRKTQWREELDNFSVHLMMTTKYQFSLLEKVNIVSSSLLIFIQKCLLYYMTIKEIKNFDDLHKLVTGLQAKTHKSPGLKNGLLILWHRTRHDDNHLESDNNRATDWSGEIIQVIAMSIDNDHLPLHDHTTGVLFLFICDCFWVDTW